MSSQLDTNFASIRKEGIKRQYGVAGALTSSDIAYDNSNSIKDKVDGVSLSNNNHIANTSNPHSVTKTQVGLGNVDNTSDVNKPVSTATQTALNGKQGNLTLTTTGTSGASTLIGDTLNIPQYSGGGGGTGDVVGPASAVDSNFAAFNTTTGKLIKDSGLSGSSILKLDQSTPQTVTGRPVLQDGLKLGTTPTVGTFEEGKLYYDANYKTVAAQIDSDVTLQIGQEELLYVKNNTGATISNGKAVYISGVDAGIPTVALAKADTYSTSIVTGVATQDILNNASGLITRRGEIRNVDTSAWSVGDILYLSDSTAGALTNVVPSNGVIEARVGRVLKLSATVGEIYVDLFRTERLTDLADVTITSPTLDQVLGYNGTEWVNRAVASASAGPGVEFFNSTPIITAAGTNNSFPIASLSKTPVTTTEQTVSGTATSNTTTFAAWLYNTALGRTTIDAGVWNFSTYAAVNSLAAGRVTTLTRNIYCAKPFATGTVTTTGTGTSRTATASAGTPFALTEIDASATNTVASYLQTPQGLYQITARTSDTVVTILVPTTYTNETAVAGTVWKKLFGATSSPITSTGTNYSLQEFVTYQGAYTVDIKCKLGVISFVTSNNTTTITLTYDGSTRNTHFSTPLLTLHNDLPGLQGGVADEYYHMTSAQATVLGNTSGTNTGDQTATTVSNTPAGNIAATNVQAAIAELDTKKVPTTRTLTINGTALDLSADRSWTIAGGGGFWTELPGTPIRVNNTTIQTGADITAYVAKGMVIKWKESGVYKLAMVAIPSTFSTPNSTITIIGDTLLSIDAGSMKYAFGCEQYSARFAIAGAIGATGTDVANSYYATEPMRVLGADLQAGTAGVTNNTTIAINKAGIGGMFTTAPTLATTVASSPTPFTADSGTSLAIGNKVTIDVTAIQTTAAVDLYVQLYLFPTRLLNLA